MNFLIFSDIDMFFPFFLLLGPSVGRISSVQIINVAKLSGLLENSQNKVTPRLEPNRVLLPPFFKPNLVFAMRNTMVS